MGIRKTPKVAWQGIGSRTAAATVTAGGYQGNRGCWGSGQYASGGCGEMTLAPGISYLETCSPALSVLG
jgi:hypothetical protein